MKAEKLAKYLRNTGAKAESFETVEAACKEAVNRAGKTGVVCALGSLYLVDEVTRVMK